MKYLCVGYFDPVKMDALGEAGVDAVMRECEPHIAHLYQNGQVILDTGLALESKCLQRVNGNLRISDGAVATAQQAIGSVFIIEAQDMADALRIAALHPTTQVQAGEQLGWSMEIRPIHYFKQGDATH